MFRDTTIDNNWWYTECQVTYNIWSINSSNAIIQFTRICASLMGVTNTTSPNAQYFIPGGDPPGNFCLIFLFFIYNFFLSILILLPRLRIALGMGMSCWFY